MTEMYSKPASSAVPAILASVGASLVAPPEYSRQRNRDDRRAVRPAQGVDPLGEHDIADLGYVHHLHVDRCDAQPVFLVR
jgi:hypothetical protein